MTKSKVLLTQHGIAPLILERDLSLAGERYLNYLLKWISKKADLHITVSQSEKYQITQRFGLPKDKIEVIYHGVEHDKFKPLKDHDIHFDSLRDRFGIEIPYILHVSSCMYKKNVVRIVQAFAMIVKDRDIDHKLVIACSCGSSYQDMLREIEANKIRDRVILTGYVGDEWLPQLYAGADIFIFPSLHESFGLPLLESMASGTPVVTSNVYSMPEIVGDAGVLVDPRDVNSIAKGIQGLLRDEGYKRELILRGIQRAKMFTWERCAKEHLRVYKEMVGL
jgi:glycosyltransferase involved in cell wall biosynthesis